MIFQKIALSKKINNWIKKNKYKCLFIQNSENLGIVKTLNKALKNVMENIFQ